MEAEHCERAGRDHVFTTTNYKITTSPRREWEVVMGRVQCSQEELVGDRFVPDMAALLQHPKAQSAGLSEPEVIAVVLYTGPMVLGPLPAIFRVANCGRRDLPPPTPRHGLCRFVT